MATDTHFINVDLADVWNRSNPSKNSTRHYVRTLAYGDTVQVKAVTTKHVEIKTVSYIEQPDGTIKPVTKSGYIIPSKKSGIKPAQVIGEIDKNKILKVDFVDVQQGDGTVVETPKGRVMLIDGGDNQLFARYLAGRYLKTSENKPKEIDCIVVSHGDADHFAGLTQIFKSETINFSKKNRWKKLFISPHRIYHNGLVKRPGKKNGKKRPDKEMFGQTKKKGASLYITELISDLTEVDTAKMNMPFRAWKKALLVYKKRASASIEFRRLKKGDHNAFNFLKAEGIKTEVLGPLVTQIDGKDSLKFLGKPPKAPHIGDQPAKFSGYSASHTVNGHSIILRMRYGNFRFLFSGDLNHEAEDELLKDKPRKLASEVFKVPHHGSADFSHDFIKAVRPIISVVSSGDENAQKEHIHPRATLMGALGRYSMLKRPLIFVTELVAFFKVEGYINPYYHSMTVAGKKNVKKSGSKTVNIPKRGTYFSFSRTAFGIVKVRTNGKRLMVYTNSGHDKKKEVYAFTAQKLGQIKPAKVKKV